MDFNPNTRLEKNADKFEIPVSTIMRLSRTVFYTLSTGETIRGLDLSHWNADTNIDFPTLKANGIDFVILKVTEGISFVDDTFKSKYEAALAAGLIVMPYHFFRGNYGGADQAKHCKDTLVELGFMDAIAYVPIVWADVESSDGISVSQRRNRLLAFLQTIEALGFQGGVYSSPYYWNSLIGSVGWIANYWQWVAHWSNVSYPTLPQGWTQEKTIVWQNGIHPAHSWVETVIGATGNVDHNYFFGTLERLKEILKFPTTPPPSGDCNCEEEFAEVYAEIARVEAEMNNNKLQIYNLQQSLQGVADEVSKLYNNDLDKEERLSALEQLVSEIEAIFTE
jgi:GH25 family lysozyme M1 (1,4-beta-N-acetylmuramidase)